MIARGSSLDRDLDGFPLNQVEVDQRGHDQCVIVGDDECVVDGDDDDQCAIDGDGYGDAEDGLHDA